MNRGGPHDRSHGHRSRRHGPFGHLLRRGAGRAGLPSRHAASPEEGTDGIGYGIEHPIFWIDRYHPHSVRQHTAFAAGSRAEVNDFHAAALEAGGTDNGPPGDRAEEWALPAPTFEYYAAFVLDPDGNNIEAVFHG